MRYHCHSVLHDVVVSLLAPPETRIEVGLIISFRATGLAFKATLDYLNTLPAFRPLNGHHSITTEGFPSRMRAI
jgi:hypothetical protein